MANASNKKYMQIFSDAHKAIKLCLGEWSTARKAERRKNEVLESIICLSPFWLLHNTIDLLINKGSSFLTILQPGNPKTRVLADWWVWGKHISYLIMMHSNHVSRWNGWAFQNHSHLNFSRWILRKDTCEHTILRCAISHLNWIRMGAC